MNLAKVCPVLLGLVACGSSASSSPDAKTPDDSVSSGLPIERYFPLVDGFSWTYDATSDDGAQNSFIVRAKRSSETKGELRGPRGTTFFSYTHEGIGLVDRNAFVLKTPLVVGTTWRGEHGGISRIEAVGKSVATAAGSFSDCIVTVEERGGDVRLTFMTTFCPDVGIVLLEADSGMQSERAELRSYGPPVFIGPPGTTMTEP